PDIRQGQLPLCGGEGQRGRHRESGPHDPCFLSSTRDGNPPFSPQSLCSLCSLAVAFASAFLLRDARQYNRTALSNGVDGGPVARLGAARSIKEAVNRIEPEVAAPASGGQRR